MGAVLQRFIGKFEEFRSLDPGEPFSIRVTEQEAEDAAREYLAENKEGVSQMIRKAAGVSLEVSDPEVRFYRDEIGLSLRGGRGPLKVRASLNADVRWNGRPYVNVRSVELPFVKVTPQKLNSLVEAPLLSAMGKVTQYADIRSFQITTGSALLEAIRK